MSEFNPNPNAYQFIPGQGYVAGGAGAGAGQGQQQGYNNPYNPYANQQQQGGYYGQPQQGGYGGYPQQGYGGYQGQQQGYGGYQPQGQGYGAGGQFGGQGMGGQTARPTRDFAPRPNAGSFRPGGAGGSGFVPPAAAVGGNASPAQTVSLNIGGGGGSNNSTSTPAANPNAAPAKSMSISIGSKKVNTPSPAPAANTSTSNTNATPAAKAMSISIGGASVKKPTPSSTPARVDTPEAAEKPKATPAKAEEPADWDEPESTPAPAPAPATTESTKPSASTPTPAPAAAPAAKKDTPASAAAASTGVSAKTFSRQAASTDADAIAKEAARVADEEILKDLYGGEEINKDDVKQHLNVVIIGHVDAGKSTLGGQLMNLTGMIDARTMEKLQKEAKDVGREGWALSYALDSDPRERAQGKTVEVGRAYFETDKRRYTILDAPGHKNFIPSMITGSSQADIAMLVISARKGEFETGFDRGGQSREHVVLVKSNGINKLIVVVNKMDDPTVKWEEARYKDIHDRLSAFLKTAGYNPNKDVTFIPVSAYTGNNMKDAIDPKVASWYKGPSLLEHLDTMPIDDRNYNAAFMLPVSEKYNDMGAIAVGKIESGRVKKGDSLLLMPNKTPVEVAGIFDEQGDELPRALSGDNVRIRLKNITEEGIQPGFVLTSPQKPIRVANQFEAQLAIVDSKNIMAAGYSCIMHLHTLSEEVTFVELLNYFDKKTGRKSKKPPAFAKKGMRVLVLLETTAPICVETFKDHASLGRFTIRDEGKTVGIGKVTKIREASDNLPAVDNLNINDSNAA